MTDEFKEFLETQPDYNPKEPVEQPPIYKPLVQPVEPVQQVQPKPPIKKLPMLPKVKEKKNRKIFWKIFAIAILLILIFFAYAFYQKEFKTEVINNLPQNNIEVKPENTYNHEIINNINITLDDKFIEDIADRIFTQINESLNDL